MNAGGRDLSDPEIAFSGETQRVAFANRSCSASVLSSNPAQASSRSTTRRSSRCPTELGDEFHDREALSPHTAPSSAAISEPGWLHRIVAAVEKIDSLPQLSTGLLLTSSFPSDVLPTLVSVPPPTHDDFLASVRRTRRAAPSEPKLHSAYAPPGGDAPDLASHDDLLAASPRPRLETLLAKLEAIFAAASALSPNPVPAAFLLAHDEVLARKVRVAAPTLGRESKLSSCF